MTILRSRDLQAVLDILEDARSLDSTETFNQPFVDRLVRLVGCDCARYDDLDTAHRICVEHISSSAEEASFPEEMDPMTDSDWDVYLSHPCYQASLAEHTGIFRLSDLARRKRLSNGDVDVIAENIPAANRVRADRLSVRIDAPGWAGFVFDRCDSSFHARELELARLLQVHLGQLWAEGVRRDRLRSSLSALDGGENGGVMLLGVGGRVQFASASARMLLHRYRLGLTEQLPAEIADWYRYDHARPLMVKGDRSVLIIEAAASSALLLHEQPAGLERLTHREREVMRCVEDGLSNIEIGHLLWIEPATVRKHLEHVYDKLGVRSRTAALAKTRARVDRAAATGPVDRI